MHLSGRLYVQYVWYSISRVVRSKSTERNKSSTDKQFLCMLTRAASDVNVCAFSHALVSQHWLHSTSILYALYSQLSKHLVATFHHSKMSRLRNACSSPWLWYTRTRIVLFVMSALQIHLQGCPSPLIGVN